MADAKHTPGPWLIHPIEPDTIIPSADTELSICVVSCVDEGSAKGWYRGPITKANARLIATAPELLSLLQDAVEAFGPHIEGGDDQWLQFARAAIAKATGSAV